MSAQGEDFEAPVRLALGVVFEAVGNGAFLQIGGLGVGDSKIYGFLEAPETSTTTQPRAVEASAQTVAAVLILLAQRWQEPAPKA